MIVNFNGDDQFKCGFGETESFVCDYGKEIPISDYSGVYSVIPSNETQTLPTAFRTLARNVVIDPIPSNYGLIEWDGSTLTVS